jgi:dihydroflavonol-4-reductase
LSRILVTGASGFLGRNLLAAFGGDEVELRALVRSEAGAETARAAVGGDRDIDVRFGDVRDAESLRAAAAGCDLVYHLAGSYRGSAEEMWDVHARGTANLIQALEPGTRLVYASSTSVYGWKRLWPADENLPPRPASPYGEAKAEAERLVLGWGGGSAVVARPTIVYGVGDPNGMLARVVRLLQRPLRLLPGDGNNRVHLTHVDDIVDAFVRMGRHGDGVLVLAGPEAAPVRRIFALLAQGAGLPEPRFGVPAAPLRAAASAAEAVWALAGRDGEPPLTRHSVEVATEDRAYSSARAAEKLGWTPRIGLDEGMPPVGAWLAAQTSAGAPRKPSAVSAIAGNVEANPSLGFDWRGYVEDPDEGLGTVYERFALRDVLESAVERTGAASVLHAPLFGMMGFPGIDAVFLAQKGVRVGLLDFDPERLEAVVSEWKALGLEPETHLVDSADPSQWPEQLSGADPYDLVFSFAALWWFDDPWAVLGAQARWARVGVLSCVPNKNVFMRMRASLWHRGLFDQLNEDALDRRAAVQAGESLGLKAVDTGLFDIPPFPDTSVPLAKVLRAALGKSGGDGGGEADGAAEGAWTWSILPYLHGDHPELEDKVTKLARWERFLPAPVAPRLAHHRYTLFVR